MFNKRGSAGKIILFSAIFIILSVALYFTFFFSYSCDDVACFRAHQKECSKTTYINDAEDTTWAYEILGDKNMACGIKVEVLKVKQGSLDKKRLEGKAMDCYLPLGDIGTPEADIENCHGLLKEELQGMIIEKLHLYVVENIGEISEELSDVL